MNRGSYTRPPAKWKSRCLADLFPRRIVKNARNKHELFLRFFPYSDEKSSSIHSCFDSAGGPLIPIKKTGKIFRDFLCWSFLIFRSNIWVFQKKQYVPDVAARKKIEN